MENKNLFKNLFLKQFNQSNAIAYNNAFVSDTNNYNFQLLDNAYRNTGKAYAKIKIAIETNDNESQFPIYFKLKIEEDFNPVSKFLS